MMAHDTYPAVDNTLKLLYNSAVSRGLPHDLTKNLSLLVYRHERWWTDRYLAPLSPEWNPHRPPDPIDVSSPRARKRGEKRRRWREMDDRAWDAISEVVRMAEGRDGLSLGRVVATAPSYRAKVDRG